MSVRPWSISLQPEGFKRFELRGDAEGNVLPPEFGDAGFGVDTNQVTLITRTDARALPLMTKAETADAILDRVAELLEARA